MLHQNDLRQGSEYPSVSEQYICWKLLLKHKMRASCSDVKIYSRSLVCPKILAVHSSSKMELLQSAICKAKCNSYYRVCNEAYQKVRLYYKARYLLKTLSKKCGLH